MFCSRCGTKLDDNAKLCHNCGLDLAPTTPVKAIASGEVTEQDLVRDALAADFEIMEELGRGGMAIVYRARDLHLQREVAVKVLPFSLAFDSEFVERFQREARTAAQLEHPNIIPIYRVGKSGRVTYFVMKFLRGQALSHLLERRGKLPPPEIRRLLIEAGGALGYAASRGVVHRDIKPDNIMFDEHGVCMVADFGIAKAATGQRLTGTGMSIGTPHYMSPEQARAQHTDGRSDIYSLGILAFQCLTGRVPYDGDDSFSIGYKHIMEPIPVPDLETPDERRLFEIVKRMIMKDPNARFQDCDELIAAIEGQPVAMAGTLRGSGVGQSYRSSRQVTTPMPRVSASQPAAEPRGSMSPRRPVARRAASSDRMALWSMLFVLTAAAAGAGYYFLKLRSDGRVRIAQDTAATTDQSVGVVSPVPAPASVAADSSMPSGNKPDTQTAVSPVRSDTVAAIVSPAGAIDSGGIRLPSLPRGTRVMVDEIAITSATIRLVPGRHVLAISAPLHHFFTDTIEIQSGVLLDVSPNLLPLTTSGPVPRQRRPTARPVVSCDEPGPGYNTDRNCFDQRPRPVNPPFVPLTRAIEGTPRPSVLLIKVSPDGKTLVVRPFNPSNDPAFERLAQQHAAAMEWRPATKSGVAVMGWTQMAFPPLRP